MGHHRWLQNQFPPFFSVLHCPLGLCELQVCSFPGVVSPPHFLSALSSSPSHCFARWFWPYLMNMRHVHTTSVCVSLGWLGGLRVVRVPAGSWHSYLWQPTSRAYNYSISVTDVKCPFFVTPGSQLPEHTTIVSVSQMSDEQQMAKMQQRHHSGPWAKCKRNWSSLVETLLTTWDQFMWFEN